MFFLVFEYLVENSSDNGGIFGGRQVLPDLPPPEALPAGDGDLYRLPRPHRLDHGEIRLGNWF